MSNNAHSAYQISNMRYGPTYHRNANPNISRPGPFQGQPVTQPWQLRGFSISSVTLSTTRNGFPRQLTVSSPTTYESDEQLQLRPCLLPLNSASDDMSGVDPPPVTISQRCGRTNQRNECLISLILGSRQTLPATIVPRPLCPRHPLVCAPRLCQIRAVFTAPAQHVSFKGVTQKHAPSDYAAGVPPHALDPGNDLPKSVEDLHHSSWTRNSEPQTLRIVQIALLF